VVKKVKQRIVAWMRYPSVAVVIGCLKIGEGVRTCLDVIEFLRAQVFQTNWSVPMSIQVGIYLAMAVTAVYAIVVAVLAIRSRHREDDMARRRRFRRPGPYSGKEVITSKRG